METIQNMSTKAERGGFEGGANCLELGITYYKGGFISYEVQKHFNLKQQQRE